MKQAMPGATPSESDTLMSSGERKALTRYDRRTVACFAIGGAAVVGPALLLVVFFVAAAPTSSVSVLDHFARRSPKGAVDLSATMLPDILDPNLVNLSLPGMYKSTLAASDPLNTTYPWLLKYLPVIPTPNNVPGNIVACGAQGRTELNGTSGFSTTDDEGGTFGIHTVLAAGLNNSREHASGPLTMAEMEEVWTTAIGDLRAPDATYSTLLDNHLALWGSSLDPYVANFEADKIGFLKITFEEAGMHSSS